MLVIDQVLKAGISSLPLSHIITYFVFGFFAKILAYFIIVFLHILRSSLDFVWLSSYLSFMKLHYILVSSECDTSGLIHIAFSELSPFHLSLMCVSSSLMLNEMTFIMLAVNKNDWYVTDCWNRQEATDKVIHQCNANKYVHMEEQIYIKKETGGMRRGIK